MYGNRLQGKKAVCNRSSLACFLMQNGVVIVDSPGVGDEKSISDIVLQHMPQAFAFIYVINTPNAGVVQKDRVSLSLLTVVLTETTEQPLFPSVLEATHELSNGRALWPTGPFFSFLCLLRPSPSKTLSFRQKC